MAWTGVQFQEIAQSWGDGLDRGDAGNRADGVARIRNWTRFRLETNGLPIPGGDAVDLLDYHHCKGAGGFRARQGKVCGVDFRDFDRGRHPGDRDDCAAFGDCDDREPDGGGGFADDGASGDLPGGSGVTWIVSRAAAAGLCGTVQEQRDAAHYRAGTLLRSVAPGGKAEL